MVYCKCRKWAWIPGTFHFVGPDRAHLSHGQCEGCGAKFDVVNGRGYIEYPGCPRCADLPDEALKVLEIERELNAAQEQDVIGGWHLYSPGVNSDKWEYCVWNRGSYPGDTRLEAARNVRDFVRALAVSLARQIESQPEMEVYDVCEELRALGYEVRACGTATTPLLLWLKVGCHVEQEHDEGPDDFHRRALRTARAVIRQVEA